jgi:hypothetical protein
LWRMRRRFRPAFVQCKEQIRRQFDIY